MGGIVAEFSVETISAAKRRVESSGMGEQKNRALLGFFVSIRAFSNSGQCEEEF